MQMRLRDAAFLIQMELLAWCVWTKSFSSLQVYFLVVQPAECAQEWFYPAANVHRLLFYPSSFRCLTTTHWTELT